MNTATDRRDTDNTHQDEQFLLNMSPSFEADPGDGENK